MYIMKRGGPRRRDAAPVTPSAGSSTPQKEDKGGSTTPTGAEGGGTDNTGNVRGRWGILRRLKHALGTTRAQKKEGAEFTKANARSKDLRSALDRVANECAAMKAAADAFEAASARYADALGGLAVTGGRPDLLSPELAERLGSAHGALGSAVCRWVRSSSDALSGPLRGRVAPDLEAARLLKQQYYDAVERRESLWQQLDRGEGTAEIEADFADAAAEADAAERLLVARLQGADEDANLSIAEGLALSMEGIIHLGTQISKIGSSIDIAQARPNLRTSRKRWLLHWHRTHVAAEDESATAEASASLEFPLYNNPPPGLDTAEGPLTVSLEPCIYIYFEGVVHKVYMYFEGEVYSHKVYLNFEGVVYYSHKIYPFFKGRGP